MTANKAIKEFDPTAITRTAGKLTQVHQVRFDSESVEVLFNGIEKDVLKIAVAKTFGDKINAEYGSRVIHDETYNYGDQPTQHVQSTGKGYNTVILPMGELNSNNICLVENLPKLAQNLQPEKAVSISQVIGGLQIATKGLQQ